VLEADQGSVWPQIFTKALVARSIVGFNQARSHATYTGFGNRLFKNAFTASSCRISKSNAATNAKSIRAFALVAAFDFDMRQLDAVNAFLNSRLPKPVYTYMPYQNQTLLPMQRAYVLFWLLVWQLAFLQTSPIPDLREHQTQSSNLCSRRSGMGDV
jgi:hypothetical protein